MNHEKHLLNYLMFLFNCGWGLIQTNLSTRAQNISLQQMLQRLLKPLAQVKGVNTSENILMKPDKLYILCVEGKTLLKSYATI